MTTSQLQHSELDIHMEESEFKLSDLYRQINIPIKQNIKIIKKDRIKKNFTYVYCSNILSHCHNILSFNKKKEITGYSLDVVNYDENGEFIDNDIITRPLIDRDETLATTEVAALSAICKGLKVIKNKGKNGCVYIKSKDTLLLLKKYIDNNDDCDESENHDDYDGCIRLVHQCKCLLSQIEGNNLSVQFIWEPTRVNSYLSYIFGFLYNHIFKIFIFYLLYSYISKCFF